MTYAHVMQNARNKCDICDDPVEYERRLRDNSEFRNLNFLVYGRIVSNRIASRGCDSHCNNRLIAQVRKSVSDRRLYGQRLPQSDKLWLSI